MFFGGCIQAQEMGEAMMVKLTKQEQSTETSGNSSHFLQTCLLSAKGKYQSVQLVYSINQRGNS